jgi:hypothetical protein
MRRITDAKSSCGTTGEKLDFLFGGSWAWSTPIHMRGAARKRSIQRMRVHAGIVASSLEKCSPPR